ncbi:hypothetical protein MXB_3326 [Myxobolus squamalis]|nr:hypothetical protein MXB_3326 [Myxobolus squamalis]
MLDEEMNSIQGKGVVALSPRVTKKNIEDNVKKIGPAGSTTGQTIQYKKSSIVTSPTKPLVESDSDDENEFMADVPQNINRLDDDEIQVKGIDAAIYVLDRINVTEVDLEPKDRHPEKRRKAAFKIYKEEEMIRLKVEQPGLTFTQKEKMIFKSWQKSPDNPVYQSRISGPN